MIAEISNPSLGVGGEISDAANLGKPVLMIYKEGLEDSVSAYVRGKADSIFTQNIHCISYSDLDHLKAKITSFRCYDGAGVA